MKISRGAFETRQHFLDFIWKNKWQKEFRKFWKRRVMGKGSLTLSNIKTCYKVLIM